MNEVRKQSRVGSHAARRLDGVRGPVPDARCRGRNRAGTLIPQSSSALRAPWLLDRAGAARRGAAT